MWKLYQCFSVTYFRVNLEIYLGFESFLVLKQWADTFQMLITSTKYLVLYFVNSLPWLVIEAYGSKQSTICFFEVHFLTALASWLCRLHRFGLFLADKLEKKFGQQFF
jgi:hypothetical protein